MDNTRLASSVFKRLFFLMEEPLVPFAFYDKAVQAGGADVQRCAQVTETLPLPNRMVLTMLFELLATYMDHPLNALNAHGFAVCFTPSLIRWWGVWVWSDV